MSANLIFRCLFFVLLSTCTDTTFAADKSILPIQTWQTSSGTPVFFVREPELPIVDIQVVFDAGSARDASKPGIAKMTNEALSAGTDSKSVDVIAAAFENVGAIYSSAVNRDMAVIALRTLSEPQSFQPALGIFSDVLTHANFPPNEFARIQNQTLRSLEEQEELPASIASKAFYNAVYDGTPYGHPISGTKASVSSLNVNDLKQFYHQFYTAQNCLIAIVGNVDERQAKDIAENLSHQLNQGKVQPAISMNAYEQSALKQHITFPSSQTNVLIGQMGIKRTDPNYFTVAVGNYILGGGLLTSRLFDEVREKRGLAYTVRSQFTALKEKGPFMIELQTRNSEAANAIKVVDNTLTQFVNIGPSNDELVSAKKNLTQGFVLKLASNSAIMGQLINIGFYHLPLNYLDAYTGNVSKVTNQQIKEVFKTMIHPEKMVTITVGQKVNATKSATSS